jgi:hypothetical protein
MSDSSYAIHRATALNMRSRGTGDAPFPPDVPIGVPGARVVIPDAASLSQRRLLEATNFVNREARIETFQAQFAAQAAQYSHWIHGVALPSLDARFPAEMGQPPASGEAEDGASEGRSARLERQGAEMVAHSDHAVATMRVAAERLHVRTPRSHPYILHFEREKKNAPPPSSSDFEYFATLIIGETLFAFANSWCSLEREDSSAPSELTQRLSLPSLRSNDRVRINRSRAGTSSGRAPRRTDSRAGSLLL